MTVNHDSRLLGMHDAWSIPSFEESKWNGEDGRLFEEIMEWAYGQNVSKELYVATWIIDVTT